MMWLKILMYFLLSYGIANIFVFGYGPFGIFESIRNVSGKISKGFGDLFSCMMCISTWIGLFLSVLDVYFIEGMEFTPFNIIMSDIESKWVVLLFDMFSTSAIVWLIHNFEEMIERIGMNEDE